MLLAYTSGLLPSKIPKLLIDIQFRRGLSHIALINLPVDVIEALICLLDFDDICSLRLTARELAAKASQGSLKTHFLTKTLDLTGVNLQALTELTKPNRLGRLLQHLIIVGITPTRRATHKEQELVGFLTEAFLNLGHLRSLTLAIHNKNIAPGMIYRPNDDWRHIWRCAGRTADIAVAAIESSSLVVERLSFYTTSRRCALSSRRLASTLDLLEIGGFKSLSELTSLSLTLSSHETHDNGDGRKLSQHLRRLAESCPKLESRELRWFSHRFVDLSCAERESRHFFTEAELTIPLLVSVSLKGIHTTAEALPSFLFRHPLLRHLSMESVSLEEDDLFRPVFDYIHNIHTLESLYLDGLYERRRHVQFSGPGKSAFPLPNSGGPTWWKWTSTERTRRKGDRVQPSTNEDRCFSPPQQLVA